MGKKIIIFVILLALAWAIPPVRERVGAAAVPVLEKLGPVGELVVNPMRGYATSQEVEHIARLIVRDRSEGHTVPDEAGFFAWMMWRIPNETGLDPWGGRYWMEQARTSVTVGSSGPDGERGNEDDVTHTVEY